MEQVEQSRVKLSVTALGILGLVLAYFGYLELLFLIIIFAVLIEKSEKLTSISLQALFLSLAYRIILLLLSWLFDFFAWITKLFEADKAREFFYNTHGYIKTVLALALLVIYVFGIMQVINKKTLRFPLLSKLADKALGLVTPVTQPAQAAYQQPVQPQQQYAPQQPYQPAAPAQSVQPAAPVAPVQQPPAQDPAALQADAAQNQTAVDTSVQASAQPTWTCTCGHENTGNFCFKCGNPRA